MKLFFIKSSVPPAGFKRCSNIAQESILSKCGFRDISWCRKRVGLLMIHLTEIEIETVAAPEERSLPGAVVGDVERQSPREPHGLRTLVLPKVLLPPGRADLAGKVSEVVGTAFPLAASMFRLGNLVVEGDWAVVVEGAASRCPDCVQGPKLAFA